MSAHTKARTTKELTKIQIEVPIRGAERVRFALGGMLSLVGGGARMLDDGDFDDDALYSFEDVFPDSTPGRRLRGLRAREGITQEDLAARLNLPQSRIAETENETRPITTGHGQTHRQNLQYFVPGVSWKNQIRPQVI